VVVENFKVADPGSLLLFPQEEKRNGTLANANNKKFAL
jgi:hypothetical protein